MSRDSTQVFERVKDRIRGLVPKVARQMMAAYLRMRHDPYYHQISRLGIHSSGVGRDGIPWVRLRGGMVFHGYEVTDAQKQVYRHFMQKHTSERLHEAAFGVAYDIAKRYVGPESRRRDIAEGKYYDLTAGESVVEIGAYMGYYAMRAAHLVGKSGSVVAIEPIAENIDILRKNVEANSLANIVIIPMAAWHSAGRVPLFVQPRQRVSILQDVVDSECPRIVSCDTVDSMLDRARIRRVDFVRIQVNGAELEVLEGMHEILKRGPRLLVSAIYERNGCASWKKIESLLRDQGYRTKVEGGNVFAAKTRTATE